MAWVSFSGPVAVDTSGGRFHVEWDLQAAVTPLGQLPYFIAFRHAAASSTPGWPTVPSN